MTIATIFSFAPNEVDSADGILDDESFDTDDLDQSSRDFLDMAIKDYNKIFKTNFDTSSKGFQDYYKDLSDKVKKREVDLLIVVNMFLTGFDATTLNTLWVDKNLIKVASRKVMKNELPNCCRNILWDSRLSERKTRKILLSCLATFSV